MAVAESKSLPVSAVTLNEDYVSEVIFVSIFCSFSCSDFCFAIFSSFLLLIFLCLVSMISMSFVSFHSSFLMMRSSTVTSLHLVLW